MTERELERRAKHKLAVLKHVEEVSGSVSATCRYYGISRNCYYRWLKRYEEEGFEGLKDRSSAPHNSPKATQAEVVEKILWLRQRYHFGPGKISMYLRALPPDQDQPLRRLADPAPRRREPTARPPSATSAAKPGGSATRSSAPDTSCRST